jgi:hypothetical protein
MMRKSAPALTAASRLPCRPATADGHAAKPYGVWKLVSMKMQTVGESTPPTQPLGPNPKGYLIILPEGRMMALLTSADRKPATTDAENAAALLKTMFAYTGRYTLDGDTFTTIPDVSWSETLTGQPQVRFFKLDGDKLSIRTADQPSAVLPGKRVVATLEWVRGR